jgi:guanine deaminase
MKYTCSDDEYFMRLAIDKAVQGVKKGQTPFGACIVKSGLVISLAHNRVWKSLDITAHAEMNAIRMACKRLKTVDLSGCVIYSTCEPCPMCFSACHWAGISAIVFGARIADAKKIGFNELFIGNQTMKRLGRGRINIIEGFLRKENLGLFEHWSAGSAKKAY